MVVRASDVDGSVEPGASSEEEVCTPRRVPRLRPVQRSAPPRSRRLPVALAFGGLAASAAVGGALAVVGLAVAALAYAFTA